MYRKKALYKKKISTTDFKPKRDMHFVVKEVKGEKNGKSRIVLTKKSPRFYHTEDDKRRMKTRKIRRKPGAPKLRSSISPGTVLILLTGRHRGKRVVFLRQLESGLLLVTGPLKFNGVPLRRVNQAYVIATSTKMDISSVDVPDKLDDDYFKRVASTTDSKKANIFAESSKSYSVSDQRKADQTVVDEQLLEAVKKVPMLEGYLKSKFSLQKGQYPHQMKF
jgi:large subunit ribosomal protein L6e